MFKALNAFFAFFESMFRAATNLAQAGENATEWAKDETAFFNHKSKLEREQKIVLLKSDNLKAIKKLGIEEEIAALRKGEDLTEETA